MKNAITALLAASGLASCAVPDLGPRPAPLTPPQVQTQTLAGGTGAWPRNDWWVGYADPQLSRLISEGLERAPDLAAAAARFRAASSVAREARSGLLPTVDVQAAIDLTKQTYNGGIPREFTPKGWNETGIVNLQLAWDLDLWGRNRAQARAAMSEADAAALELTQARLVLSTGIADAYAELVRLIAERDVSLDTIALRSNTRRLVAERVANGLDTQAELKQAIGAIPAAEADLAATDEAIGLAKNQLAMLVGQGPDLARSISAPSRLSGIHGIPADVRTDLLARRPDIRAALARVEAAAARIKVARTAFYPSLNITSLIGLQALGLDRVFKTGSTYGNASPALGLPIFQGGALRARYRGARAEYDEAVAQYDATVIQAFREVADVAVSRQALVDRLGKSEAALAASREAFDIAQLRYKGGLSTFLDVLTAQNAVLINQRASAVLSTRAFALDVSLVRALGGGYFSPPPTGPAAPPILIGDKIRG
ncbi:MAG TPA: efflux transporter outer membrane subunit [Sphingomonas sp.]